MKKELKKKLVSDILIRVPFLNPKLRENLVDAILDIDNLDTKAQEAYVLASKIAEKKALEVKVAEAQRVLETDVPRLNTLIAELPAEVVEPLEEEIEEIIEP